MANKQQEVEAIEAAEKGQLQQGLDILNRAIEQQPRRPSLFNNRAYIYQYLRRFQGNVKELGIKQIRQRCNCCVDAFNDLTMAIELSNEKHRKTLCQAYCQRGILHKRANRKELAKVDFEKAAELGSKFAKSQVSFFWSRRL